MIKWKCSICSQSVQTDVKPVLWERLCPDCKVAHCRRVVDIYDMGGDKQKLKDAKAALRDAITALKKSQVVKEGIK